MVKVKICGITDPNEARLAARFGADALGFNFVPASKRFVGRDRARAIIAAIPPFVTPVGVFANERAEKVLEICEFCGIQTVQLHGDEPPAYLSLLPRLKRIKAIRVGEEADLRQLSRYTCEAFLLDTLVPDLLGGTGKTFNWEWAREAARHGPIILAGGLTPENVSEAIRIAQPYAVDVASGVESAPGAKDRKLMAQFIINAKSVPT
jgi:phosphoribosylanthranilate isomerase